VPRRRLPGRKLLVASLGVAAVSYAGCRNSAEPVANLVASPPVLEPVGNLPAPPPIEAGPPVTTATSDSGTARDAGKGR
jgi:hypothetical protein